jgi:putative DNA primase/helicase
MIPFSVKIAPEQRDPMLPMKLKGEWPGILGWAVEGCLEWQRRGLAPPPAVTCATEEYLGEEDATGRWLDECCDLHRDAKEGSSALYDSWRAWAEQAGEPAGSQKRFSQALQQRGFTPDRLGKGKAGFTGLKLNVSPPRSEPRGDRE